MARTAASASDLQCRRRWTGGFFLPGRGASRVVLGSLSLNGVGTLSFNGRIAADEPSRNGMADDGVRLDGYADAIDRAAAEDRPRSRSRSASRAELGHPDRRSETAVFSSCSWPAQPAFRKYDDKGALIYERIVQGREIDPLVAAIPDRWPRRSAGELPLVAPMVRTAAVDRSGRLWISFVIPFSYVYDAGGEKIQDRPVPRRRESCRRPASGSTKRAGFWSHQGVMNSTPGCHDLIKT